MRRIERIYNVHMMYSCNRIVVLLKRINTYPGAQTFWVTQDAQRITNYPGAQTFEVTHHAQLTDQVPVSLWSFTCAKC